MLRFIPLFILILMVLSSGQAFSQESEKTELPDFESLKRTSTGKVSRVLDGLTIQLKDDRIIRLSELDIPGFIYPQPSDISLKAKKLLNEKLPAGTDILIYQTKTPKTGRVNRMEQILAHVVIKDKPFWAQRALVTEGLARTAPTITNFEMSKTLYDVEAKARDNKTGLWADDVYPLKTEDTAGDIVGQFGVIEGHIEKVASVKNNVYLNFGKDWRTDFTVMVKPAIRKKLVREGIDPLSLNNKAVRVRGWVREYNGPLIELNHPFSLEILPAPETRTMVEGDSLKN